MTTEFNQPDFLSILIANAISQTVQLELSHSTPDCSLIFSDTTTQTELLLTHAKFDLILLERSLITTTFLQALNHSDHINFNIPLIALTDTLSVTHRQSLIAEGFDDCQPAPLTADNFIEIRNVWLGSSPTEQVFNSIQQLLAKVNNDSGLVLTLWEHLLTELPIQISSFAEALKHQAFDDAYHIIHKMNGSMKICCLSRIELLTSGLERDLIGKQYGTVCHTSTHLTKEITSLLNQQAKILNYIKRLSC